MHEKVITLFLRIIIVHHGICYGEGGEISKRACPSSPPTSRMMPPVMATRDLRSLSLPPQVVHFIPIHATPNPATDTMMPTIIKARVA